MLSSGGGIDLTGDPLAEADALGRRPQRRLAVLVRAGAQQDPAAERFVRRAALLGTDRQVLVDAAAEAVPKLGRRGALEMDDVAQPGDGAGEGAVAGIEIDRPG